ncbi:MAG: DUF4127 family protein [Oscillospiraceae bacterium]|nr:DUF4127 family protein [Oscillospiraceae bacterium]
MEKLQRKIPANMEDFLNRRKINRYVNLTCVDFGEEGVFDILTVPKGDMAEYGFSAMDQAAIAERVREMMNWVLVYPGADEVGSVLFARMFCLIKNSRPRVLVHCSSVVGPQIVPKNEDRPLHAGVKSQITSLGAFWWKVPDRPTACWP